MKTAKIKEPVKIRYKNLAGGNKSIYLDIYQKGRRKYEFLQLYLIPETCPGDRVRNEQTLAVANAVKAQRIVEMQNIAHGFSPAKSRSKLLLTDFLANEQDHYYQKDSRSYGDLVGIMAGHIRHYAGNNVLLRDVDRKFIEGFISYLRRIRRKNGELLSESTQNLYLRVLGVVLNRAVQDDLIDKNPVKNISLEDRPQAKSTGREFLTLDEVRKLSSAPCPHEGLKQAFLFACFCGLRLSDINALSWENIREMSDGMMQIEIIQEKTREEVHIPLGENALALLPPKTEDRGLLFKLPHRITMYKYLNDWARSAKITKHLTFHVARHTCATMLLTYGADIYTVSKLLGHANVKTTQIYAKIVDEKKFAAVNLIPTL